MEACKCNNETRRDVTRCNECNLRRSEQCAMTSTFQISRLVVCQNALAEMRFTFHTTRFGSGSDNCTFLLHLVFQRQRLKFCTSAQVLHSEICAQTRRVLSPPPPRPTPASKSVLNYISTSPNETKQSSSGQRVRWALQKGQDGGIERRGSLTTGIVHTVCHFRHCAQRPVINLTIQSYAVFTVKIASIILNLYTYSNKILGQTGTEKAYQAPSKAEKRHF